MSSWLVLFTSVTLFAATGQDKGHDGKPAGIHGSRCPEGMEKSGEWEASELVGFALRLVDSKRAFVLSFKKNGVVITTIGKIGGPISAPVMSWRIQKNGRLCIGEDNQAKFQLRKICFGDHRFIVELDGKIREFIVEKD